MTREEKAKLLQFFYVNEQTQTFLCNDLYQEFKSFIPIETCISIENRNTAIRRNRYDNALLSIHNFFANNKDYKIIIEKLFSGYEERFLEAHLLMGYVFYIALTERKDFDIFNDKLSLCYCDGPSILDIIC